MTDWDAYRVILAVGRGGSLSAAARVLGVNHATVSRQLARAEHAMGRPLFDRLPGGLRATADGRAMMEAAAAMEEEVLALDMRLNANDELAGKLVVTAPPLIIESGLAQDIAAFAKALPQCQIEVRGSNEIADLRRREADVAIRVDRTPAETLFGRRMVAQRQGYFASPDFLNSTPLGPDCPLPVISFTVYGEPIPPALARAFPKAFIAATTDDMVTARALARAGLGVVRMPMILSGDAGLTRLESPAPSDYADIWILTHPDLRRTARIRKFMSFVAERFAARAERYA